METRGTRDSPTTSANAEAKLPSADETLAEGSRRRTGGQKRKAAAMSVSSTFASTSSSSTPPKRLLKERNALNILPGAAHNGPWTRARQPPNKLAADSVLKLQDGACATGMAGGEGNQEVVASGDPVRLEEEGAEPPDEPVVDAEFEAVRSRSTDIHVVPTPSGWFSWKKIHELEKHALPSFFNGQSDSRTAEIYMDIRNSIMKKFHVDPQTPLEVKDLSDISAGEVGARQEVMEFLDHWGLINFHPFPHRTTDAGVPEAGANNTSSLLDQLYRFGNVETLPFQVPKKQEASSPSMLPHLFPEPSLLDDMVRPVDPSVEYHCNSCSADCSRKRYHCQKQADFDLCAECYNNGTFGSGMTPADFILMESAEGPGVSGRSWTDQETILLLEALELFGENWNEIAEHVATKTKAQCIMHFLQMPIEDPFLEGKDNANDSMKEEVRPCSVDKGTSANAHEAMEHDNGMSSDHPVTSPSEVSERKDTEIDLSRDDYSSLAINALKGAFEAVHFTHEEGRTFSFAEAGNPVMLLAAFLMQLVDQDAVLTSSRSSLNAMSEESPGTQLASRHCFILEDPPNETKSSPVSESGETPKEEHLPSSNGSTELKDGIKNHLAVTASPMSELKQSASSHEASPKLSPGKESSDSFLPVNVASSSNKNSDDKPLLEEQASHSDRKDASNIVESVVPTSSNLKELGDLPQDGNAPNVVKIIDDLKVSDEDKPKSVEQSVNAESVDLVLEVPDSAKVVDNTPTSIVMKEEETQQKDGVASTLNIFDAGAGDDQHTSSLKNGANISTTADSPHNINNIKRAAVSVLSAAAVKAKLLANQEEGQIRQLVSFVIEKQLRKMEIKLAFFSEMESVIMRAKDQTERARQKLIHERAQIIAARLGLPPPSSRPFPASLTATKFAMGYGSINVRPPSMAYQKPPPPRRP